MELRSLDWDRLKIFQAVAESGSISAAAAKLAVSHAKISRDIEELEHALGAELFSRSPRGMQVTALGSDILRSVRSMADSANAITQRLKGSDQATKVVIAAQDGMATYWLARKLPQFLQTHPDVEVEFRVVPDTPNLAGGDGDIAIQYEPPSAPNLISRQLGWVHYVLYASPGYLSIFGTPQTMFDLGRHRFFMLTGYNKQRDMWSSKTPAWVEILSRSLTANSSTVLVEACAGDGGICPLPTYLSEIEPRIVPLTHIAPLASARFWMAYSERLRDLKQCEPVLAWLREIYDPLQYPCFRETYVAPKPPANAIGR